MKAMSDATKKFFVEDGAGYYIAVRDSENGFRWAWRELGELDDVSGEIFPSISEALAAAADDWDGSGSGGDLAARLRRSAAQYRRNENRA